VKIIVGFAPGGGTDMTVRFIAQRLSSAMGQQFIVDNKPGAGGSIAYSAGINSPPDGYTLTLISVGYAVNPSLYKVKFDAVNDITPITQIAQGALVVVVNPSVPAKTTQDLIALAKSRPGKLNYASGAGTNSHLATELFASMAGIKMNNVPTREAALRSPTLSPDRSPSPPSPQCCTSPGCARSPLPRPSDNPLCRYSDRRRIRSAGYEAVQ
jgi:tripartite-type tricarboxylate transporter receptor subunit TctC